MAPLWVTTTNEQGNFELDISKYANRPLTISAVGYSSSTINDFYRQHFFRALWADSLSESEFVVRSSRSGSNLSYEEIVYQDMQGIKFLHYPENMTIEYNSNLSYITFLDGRVLFHQDGYFDPIQIIWIGEMARERIAVFLLFEYLLPQ